MKSFFRNLILVACALGLGIFCSAQTGGTENVVVQKSPSAISGDVPTKQANGKIEWHAQSASGGGGTWGSITGTLSAQTDLQTALDAKLGITAATSLYQPLNAKLTGFAALANSAGYLFNNGSGVFSYSMPSGAGDFSSNTSVSVDGEFVLFFGTAGKTGKRAIGTGIARANSGASSFAELSGDATTSGSNVVTIAANAVTNAKAAQMATKTYKGRTSSGTGNSEDVAVATLKADLLLVKGDVGLGNVDNTPDASKPVSTAQQTALDLKADLAGDNPYTGKNSFTDYSRDPTTPLATGTQTAAIGKHYVVNPLTSTLTISALSGTLADDAKIVLELRGCNGTTAAFDFTGFGTAKRNGATNVTSTSLTPTAGNHTFVFVYDLASTTWFYSDTVPSPVNLAGGANSVVGQLPAANVVTSTFITTGSAEINALTSKATPTTSDQLMIEDAAASNAKKKVTVDAVLAANDARVKTLSNTRNNPYVETLADAATVTPNFAKAQGVLATVSQNTTIANPTGTPVDGQLYLLAVKSISARTWTWDTQYRGSSDLALPTTSKGGTKWEYLGFRWNGNDGKADLIALVQGF